MNFWTIFRECTQPLLNGGELELIISNRADALTHLEQARRNLLSAGLLEVVDPNASLSCAYDAVRKSLEALLLVEAMRVRKPAGNHWTYVKLSRCSIFQSEIWEDFAWLRGRRNSAEYFSLDAPEINASDARAALEFAERALRDVAGKISS